MGRPANTIDRAEQLHHAMLSAKGPHAKVPSELWHRIICMQWRVGVEMAYKVTHTGELLGLWRRGRDPSIGGRGAYVEILPAEVVTIPDAPQMPALASSA